MVGWYAGQRDYQSQCFYAFEAVVVETLLLAVRIDKSAHNLHY